MRIKMTRDERNKLVVLTRLNLYNQGDPCGPKAIWKKMEEEYSEYVIPSTSTIARILEANYLTHRRTGYYPEEHDTPFDWTKYGKYWADWSDIKMG